MGTGFGDENDAAEKEGSKDYSKRRQKVMQQTSEHSTTFWSSTRFLILFISTLCCTLAFENSLTLNFTIICMSDDPNRTNSYNNETASTKKDYSYSAKEQAWLFSGVAIGSFLGALPLPFLNSKFGIRIIFTIYGLTSALATFFIPFAASLGYVMLFLMRILQGAGVSATFPAQGSIVNEWATKHESGLFLAFMSCHHQFAQISLMPIAGLFCESSIGWQGIYYLQGSLTFAIFVMFCLFFRNFPKEHSYVSKAELSKINDGKVDRKKSKHDNIPYQKMVSDKSVIGVWIGSIGSFTGFQLFLQYGPTFLNKVLKMNIEETGIAGALPFVGALLVKVISGPLSDRLTFISNTRRCQIFGSISQFSMALCIVALAWMPTKSQIFAQIAFTAAIMFSSLNVVGIVKCAQLQASQYAHVTMTVITFINSGIVLFLPILVSSLAPENTYSEWAIIFYTVALLLVITTIIFDITCEAEPRPWTYENFSSLKSDAEANLNILEEEKIERK